MVAEFLVVADPLVRRVSKEYVKLLQRVFEVCQEMAVSLCQRATKDGPMLFRICTVGFEVDYAASNVDGDQPWLETYPRHNRKRPDSVVLGELFDGLKRKQSSKAVELVWLLPAKTIHDTWTPSIMEAIFSNSSSLRHVGIICEDVPFAMENATMLLQAKVQTSVRCRGGVDVVEACDVFSTPLRWQGSLRFGSDSEVVQGLCFIDHPCSTSVDHNHQPVDLLGQDLKVVKVIPWEQVMQWIHMFSGHSYEVGCFDPRLFPATNEFLHRWVRVLHGKAVMVRFDHGHVALLHVAQDKLVARPLRPQSELQRLARLLSTSKSLNSSCSTDPEDNENDPAEEEEEEEETHLRMESRTISMAVFQSADELRQEQASIVDAQVNRIDAAWHEKWANEQIDAKKISLEECVSCSKQAKFEALDEETGNRRRLTTSFHVIAEPIVHPREDPSGSTEWLELDLMQKAIPVTQVLSKSSTSTSSLGKSTNRNTTASASKTGVAKATRRRGEQMLASSVAFTREKKMRTESSLLCAQDLVSLYKNGELEPLHGWSKAREVYGKRLAKEMHTRENRNQTWVANQTDLKDLAPDELSFQTRIRHGIDLCDSRGLALEEMIEQRLYVKNLSLGFGPPRKSIKCHINQSGSLVPEVSPDPLALLTKNWNRKRKVHGNLEKMSTRRLAKRGKYSSSKTGSQAIGPIKLAPKGKTRTKHKSPSIKDQNKDLIETITEEELGKLVPKQVMGNREKIEQYKSLVLQLVSIVGVDLDKALLSPRFVREKVAKTCPYVLDMNRNPSSPKAAINALLLS